MLCIAEMRLVINFTIIFPSGNRVFRCHMLGMSTSLLAVGVSRVVSRERERERDWLIQIYDMKLNQIISTLNLLEGRRRVHRLRRTSRIPPYDFLDETFPVYENPSDEILTSY